MTGKLFHISENPSIKIFKPKPSPTHFDLIKGDVVFAVSEELLHNYLFPRDCPRVTFYCGENTTDADKKEFFNSTTSEHIIIVENHWFTKIKNAKIFCYEFINDDFSILDECADYYISYQPVIPISVQVIEDIFDELFKRNIELRFMPNLQKIASQVSQSTLNFSLIRMKNAK